MRFLAQKSRADGYMAARNLAGSGPLLPPAGVFFASAFIARLYIMWFYGDLPAFFYARLAGRFVYRRGRTLFLFVFFAREKAHMRRVGAAKGAD